MIRKNKINHHDVYNIYSETKIKTYIKKNVYI